jgi:hypothetical protein
MRYFFFWREVLDPELSFGSGVVARIFRASRFISMQVISSA